jgi:hypothetical protein
MAYINNRIIPAKLKILSELIKVYPEAASWHCAGPFPSADAVIIPYLGKMVRLKQIWFDAKSFFFEISGTGGIIVLPEWIDYFETDELIPLDRHADEYDEPHEFNFLKHLDDISRCLAADIVIIFLW